MRGYVQLGVSSPARLSSQYVSVPGIRRLGSASSCGARCVVVEAAYHVYFRYMHGARDYLYHIC